jgi:carbamoyltransferase
MDRLGLAGLSPCHMDIAASIQKVTEKVMLRLSRSLAREHRLDNLCLGGGLR